MRQLENTTLEHVSGGNPLIVGVGIGIGSNYLYEAVGGKEGIDTYFSNSWSSMRASARYWIKKVS